MGGPQQAPAALPKPVPANLDVAVETKNPLADASAAAPKLGADIPVTGSKLSQSTQNVLDIVERMGGPNPDKYAYGELSKLLKNPVTKEATLTSLAEVATSPVSSHHARKDAITTLSYADELRAAKTVNKMVQVDPELRETGIKVLQNATHNVIKSTREFAQQALERLENKPPESAARTFGRELLGVLGERAAELKQGAKNGIAAVGKLYNENLKEGVESGVSTVANSSVGKKIASTGKEIGAATENGLREIGLVPMSERTAMGQLNQIRAAGSGLDPSTLELKK